MLKINNLPPGEPFQDAWHISPCNSPMITYSLLSLGFRTEAVIESVKRLKELWEDETSWFCHFFFWKDNSNESLNSQLRRVTKTKGVFPSDEALEKIIYLKMARITEKWGVMPMKNWASILSQLMIYFDDSVSDWGKILV